MEMPPLLRCVAYGVGQEDEGVCLAVELGPYRILLDCGLANSELLAKELVTQPLDGVICSHAHLDHVQSLGSLLSHAPDLPLYMSEVTATLVLAQYPSLKLGAQWQILPWRSPVQLAGTPIEVQLFPAGHLPGAASILLTYPTAERTYTVLYTGDFCRAHSRLTEGLNLETLRGAEPDVLIVEGSYGVERYPHHRQQDKQFLAQLDRELLNGRSILLLAPPLGLAQEILVLLRSHHQFTGRDLDIWVDEPIAHLCDQYLGLLPHLPIAVQNFARHQPLFWDTSVLPRVQRYHSPKSLDFSSSTTPSILLSNTFPADLPLSPSWCCFVPQRELRQLDLEPEQLRSLSCSVIPYCLTDHSDLSNTLQLIHNIRPQHIVWVHGSPFALQSLTGLDELQRRYQIHLPSAGAIVELPLGDRFVQDPSLPPQICVGEISEWDTQVTLTFPINLTESPLWSTFAGTGLVEARWQGHEIRLHGLSQQELSQQVQSTLPTLNEERCDRCAYYHYHQCHNVQSPLYQLQVRADGNCPLFTLQQSESDDFL